MDPEKCLITANLNPYNIFLIIVWAANPTITVSETMTYPIEKVLFPTVTICPTNANLDRWGVPVKIFDYLKRRCPAEE